MLSVQDLALAVVMSSGAFVAAQSEQTSGWTASKFGVDATEHSAMDLGLRAVARGSDDTEDAIVVDNGASGELVALMAGFEEAHVPLGELADGVLLVAPAPIVVLGKFEDSGERAVSVDLRDPALVGLKLYLQAASIAVRADGLSLRLSHGLRISGFSDAGSSDG